jgi:hypothetical protein
MARLLLLDPKRLRYALRPPDDTSGALHPDVATLKRRAVRKLCGERNPDRTSAFRSGVVKPYGVLQIGVTDAAAKLKPRPLWHACPGGGHDRDVHAAPA